MIVKRFISDSWVACPGQLVLWNVISRLDLSKARLEQESHDQCKCQCYNQRLPYGCSHPMDGLPFLYGKSNVSLGDDELAKCSLANKIYIYIYLHYPTNRILDSINRIRNVIFLKKFEVTDLYVLRSPKSVFHYWTNNY